MRFFFVWSLVGGGGGCFLGMIGSYMFFSELRGENFGYLLYFFFVDLEDVDFFEIEKCFEILFKMFYI